MNGVAEIIPYVGRKREEEGRLRVVEIFPSWQGEGRWTGHAMTFLRLAGCNLRCSWCDQPEASYGERLRAAEMGAEEVLDAITFLGIKRVCVTGGEPLLQAESLEKLFPKLIAAGYLLHLETNGTIFSDLPWEWVSVSPKKGVSVDPRIYIRADEFKFIVDEHFSINDVASNAKGAQVYLQPCNDVTGVNKKSLLHTLDILRRHPNWALSVQLHKLINVR